MKSKVLVTGAAGFIGSALIRKLAELEYDVIGIDNINNYYDPRLKIDRLASCGIHPQNTDFVENAIPEVGLDRELSFVSFRFGDSIQSEIFPNLKFVRLDITDREQLPLLFVTERFDYVISLAAQAGVRYSIKNPWAYLDSNVYGFLNILECCRKNEIKHLIYASSSSVYGLNTNAPFRESDKVDSPVSLYAATKKSNELMAFSYSKMYGVKTTGLRFFTVYGPWGRPDMAPMLFADAIYSNTPIKVFNHGELIRDFTFIDDIINGTILTMKRHFPDDSDQSVPAKLYNIGCGHPVNLMDFISTLEAAIGTKAIINYMPMQLGDVYMTNADTSLLETEVGYTARVQLKEGIQKFVEWYNHYYRNGKE